jgi:hypothetical protein
MENRFEKLGIECKFYSGIEHTDNRLKYAGNKKAWNRVGVNQYQDELIYQCFNPNNQDFSL